MSGKGAAVCLVFCLAVSRGRAAVSAEPEQSETNLAPNAGFEMPAGAEGVMPVGWAFFTTTDKPRIGVTSSEKHEGAQCVRLAACGVKGAIQGIFLDAPVREDEKYTFQAYVRSDPAAPLEGSAEGMIVIEWLDARNREIARAMCKPFDSNLSRLHWTRVALKRERPPRGAVKARFGIHLAEGDRGGRGAFLVDDVFITK